MLSQKPCCLILAPFALALVTLLAGGGCTETATADDPGPPVEEGDAGPDAAVASTCVPPAGEGTTHASGALASDDETWTAAGSPHVVDFTLTIGAGKTLTIEPCAVVRIRKGMGVYVRGKLVAEGAADEPITIERADAADPWSVIEAGPTSELRFVHTSIEGGGFANGSPLDTFGMLDVRGDQEAPTQGRLHADHLTLKGSASLGLLLREGGGLTPGSRDLTISGGASYPIGTWGRAAGTIPTGAYTGNAIDAIVIAGLGGRDAVREDATLANRGVPYFVKGSQLSVGAPTGTEKATLTIEPGVTMRFAKGSRLLMDGSTSNGPANGVLRAIGTAAAPIVFTSAEAAPAPGDWTGLLFKGTPDANDAIDHARIAYAGGVSGISSYDCPSPANPRFTNQGAIIVYGGQPASAFVTNTAIEDSAADGIVRGWTGDALDFLASNTFSGIAQCHQTHPRPAVSACPNPAPCPRD